MNYDYSGNMFLLINFTTKNQVAIQTDKIVGIYEYDRDGNKTVRVSTRNSNETYFFVGTLEDFRKNSKLITLEEFLKIQ